MQHDLRQDASCDTGAQTNKHFDYRQTIGLGASVNKTRILIVTNKNNRYMGISNMFILMVYALVVLAMVVGLFVLDTAHHRSDK